MAAALIAQGIVGLPARFRCSTEEPHSAFAESADAPRLMGSI